MSQPILLPLLIENQEKGVEGCLKYDFFSDLPAIWLPKSMSLVDAANETFDPQKANDLVGAFLTLYEMGGKTFNGLIADLKTLQ